MTGGATAAPPSGAAPTVAPTGPGTSPQPPVAQSGRSDPVADPVYPDYGNPVYLAPNKYNLQVTMERWPTVGFHATREHGQRLAQMQVA